MRGRLRELTLNGSQPGDEGGAAGWRGAGAMKAAPFVHRRRRLHCYLVLEVCKIQNEKMGRCIC